MINQVLSKVEMKLKYLFIILDWLLFIVAIYLIIFNTSMWGTLIGFILFMISFVIIEKVEGVPYQMLRPTKNEWLFIGVWLAIFLLLNLFWSDAYLAAPYFNTALFLYFGYRVYRSIKQMK